MSDEREPRDERGPTDARDERDERRPDDARDERDVRGTADDERPVRGLIGRHPFFSSLVCLMLVAVPGYIRVENVAEENAENISEAAAEVAVDNSRNNCRGLNKLRSGIIGGVRMIESEPDMEFQVPPAPLPELEPWVNQINEALRGDPEDPAEPETPISDTLELAAPLLDCTGESVGQVLPLQGDDTADAAFLVGP